MINKHELAADQKIDRELDAYQAMRENLEASHMNEFVVIKETQLHGVFDTLDSAASFARQEFGMGPYLIRQIGASFRPSPASILYRSIADA